ncbi:TonB-dependent receptor [Caulobacter hibisci]|uniref:TonB-dependent receptor n=1 Tax=Caulobacter hibisci TaxID=2035993 RepID=A0ABS0SRT1_9CAUL|nr:TonB-dependent receptor [Caulobacter hibisci]MBI1682322.1 TonB-dependent receptor [Caulobacter hibisci]
MAVASLVILAAMAAPAADTAATPTDVSGVVVSAAKRGEALGGQAPLVAYDPLQIQAFGAATVDELIELLEAQTTSARGGSPVFLINGRRISGFQELRGLPTEAIEQFQILPEQTALSYGYSADQRVVNIILRERFRSLSEQVDAERPEGGGRTVGTSRTNALRIQGGNRWSLGLDLKNQSALYEDERDIDRSETGETTAGRTLAPRIRQAQLQGVMKRDLTDKVGLTVSGGLKSVDEVSRLGDGADGLSATLQKQTKTTTADLGALADGFLGAWAWTGSLAYQRIDTDSATDRETSADPTRASSVAQSVKGDLVTNGALLSLPAGSLRVSLKAGGEHSSLESQSIDLTKREVSRDQGSVQASVDLPLTAAGDGLGDRIGAVSANFNLAAAQVSDFGTLRTLGAGLNWTPVEKLVFTGDYTTKTTAPTLSQLNDPDETTPNVAVFDYLTGKTVSVTQRSGGNADLEAPENRILHFGVNWTPTSKHALQMNLNWTRTEVLDGITSLTGVTAGLEDALPERFTRALDGTLTSIDTRPINIAREVKEEVAWGFTFSQAFGKPMQFPPRQGFGPPGGGPPDGGPPPGEGGGPPPGDGGGPPPGMGGPGGPPGGGPGGRRPAANIRPGQGMLNVSLTHTWRLKDEVTVRDGSPVLDLLDGDSISGSGGEPEHEVKLQVGASRRGVGGFVNAKWESGTVTKGEGTTPDYRFGDLATVNLRLFADLSQRREWVQKQPWLRGVRVTAEVTNLFDARTRVTSSDGSLPLTYQPDYLDPLGRVFRVGVRKIMF